MESDIGNPLEYTPMYSKKKNQWRMNNSRTRPGVLLPPAPPPPPPPENAIPRKDIYLFIHSLFYDKTASLSHIREAFILGRFFMGKTMQPVILSTRIRIILFFHLPFKCFVSIHLTE